MIVPIKYDSRSPYSRTTQTDKYVQYLDVWTPPAIVPAADDTLIKLDTKYKNRPDLLSFDTYGTAQLWWIFAARNPDIIKDPIYDFTPGITIYIPSKSSMGTVAQ